MVIIDDKKFKSALNELRELLNWIAVLEEEYDISPKDARATRAHLQKAARLLGEGIVQAARPALKTKKSVKKSVMKKTSAKKKR